MWRKRDSRFSDVGILVKSIRAPLTGKINTLVFSPDGGLLAASSLHSGMICLWSTESWKLLRKIDCKSLFAKGLRYFLSPLANAAEEMTCLYHSISFHPNKNLLAASFPPSKIQIWDLSDGSLRTSFGSIGSSVAFSPSGKVIAAEGRLWDSETLTQVCNLEGGNFMTWIEFDRSEHLLAASCSDIHQDGRLHGSIRVWRLPEGELVKEFLCEDPSYLPSAVAFSKDSRFLAADVAQNRIRVWQVESFKPIGDIEVKQAASLAFSPKDDLLAVGEFRGLISFYTVPHLQLWARVHEAGERVTFCPRGSLMASSRWSHIKVFELVR